MMVRLAGPLAIGLVALGSLVTGCGPKDQGLPEPFAAVIPSCSITVEAPNLDEEHADSAEIVGEDGMLASATRACKGGDLTLTMTVHTFNSESDASSWTNQPSPEEYSLPASGLRVWSAEETISVPAQAEEFVAYHYSSLDFENDQGSQGIKARFRMGRYGGEFTSQADGGELVFNQSVWDYWVEADPHPEMLQKVLDETLLHWPEPLR